MLRAKVRQLRFALRGGRVTLDYPLRPRPSEAGFRGRVTVDTDKCIGCAGCADVCPARCILITDLAPTERVIRRHLDRCIHCGRCEAVCRYDAVHLVAEYELSTAARADLMIEQRLFMGVCDRCGRCFVPGHPLDRLMVRAWREDEPWLIGAAAGEPGKTEE